MRENPVVIPEDLATTVISISKLFAGSKIFGSRPKLSHLLQPWPFACGYVLPFGHFEERPSPLCFDSQHP